MYADIWMLFLPWEAQDPAGALWMRSMRKVAQVLRQMTELTFDRLEITIVIMTIIFVIIRIIKVIILITTAVPKRGLKGCCYYSGLSLVDQDMS